MHKCVCVEAGIYIPTCPGVPRQTPSSPCVSLYHLVLVCTGQLPAHVQAMRTPCTPPCPGNCHPHLALSWGGSEPWNLAGPTTHAVHYAHRRISPLWATPPRLGFEVAQVGEGLSVQGNCLYISLPRWLAYFCVGVPCPPNLGHPCPNRCPLSCRCHGSNGHPKHHPIRSR
jgi:hypothetical protein